MLGRRKARRKDPIAEFWSWWGRNRSGVEAAIPTGNYGSLVDEITARVAAIASGLEWELGKGRQARHLLCVTAAGNPELRATAERWRLRGLDPDATWEYASARAPDPGMLDNDLSIEGTRLRLGEVQFGVLVDEDRQLVHVEVHHPLFHQMADRAKLQVAYLTLDWLLGEDAVDRWVGRVDVSDPAPAAAVPADGLQECVAALKDRNTERTWAVLSAEAPDGRPVVATALSPLKRAEFPLFDLHGAIKLPFAEQRPTGLPDGSALDRLRSFEDGLVAAGGDTVLLAAHQTHAGTRLLHVYCDSEGAGRGLVDAFVSTQGWPGGRVTWRMDPAWTALRTYT